MSYKIEDMEAYTKGAIASMPAGFWPKSWVETDFKVIRDGIKQPKGEYETSAAVRSYARGQIDFRHMALVPHDMLKKGEAAVHFIDRVREEQAELKQLRAKIKRIEKQCAA